MSVTGLPRAVPEHWPGQFATGVTEPLDCVPVTLPFPVIETRIRKTTSGGGVGGVGGGGLWTETVTVGDVLDVSRPGFAGSNVAVSACGP